MVSRGRFILLAIVLLASAAGLYLVGNASVQLWDRDEPRYAECSREMLYGSPEHPGSDFVVPRFLGKPRYAKPPMIYWLQAGAMRMGDNAFAARFPSTVAMLIVLAMVALAVRRLTDNERALWTAFILATSVLTFAAAKSSLTDAVQLVFILIAQGCAYATWRGRGSWAVFAVFGVAVGIAGLVKGPVVLAMVGATGGMLIIFHWIDWWLHRRQLRQEGARGFEIPGPPGIDFPEPVQPDPLRKSIASELDAPLPGFQTSFKKWALFTAKGLLALVIVVAIVGPWVYLIEQRSPGFLNTSWSTNIVDRIQRGSEGHSGPPGYYLLTIWGTYFPWSLFIPMAIVFAWKRRAMPRIRFALAAVLGPWIMLECVQTKLPHYLLPAFPFLAFLTADALVRCFKNEHDDLIRKSFVGFARGWAVAVIAVFGVGSWLMAYLFRPQPWFGLAVVSLVAIAYGLTVYLLFRAQRLREGIFAMGAGMAALVVAMFTVFLPYAGYLHTSMRVADILKAHGATGAGEVMMQDYKEPSLAFYQGGTIRELSDMRIIPDHTTPWLVTTKEVYDKTPADIRELYEVIDTVKGLAYADGGRVVEVMILRKR